MFISPRPDSTRVISFRSDDEMAHTLSALSSLLRTSRSTLIRIAVSKLIREARTIKPILLRQLFDEQRTKNDTDDRR